MATKEELIAYATSKIGTTEHEPGSNCQEFSEKLGRPCGPWSFDFILACLQALEVREDLDEAVADLVEGLESGDVLVFTQEIPFDSGSQHYGMFVRYLSNGNIETIEGNTSSGNSGSQDDGDGVYRRERTLQDIVNAMRPYYTETTRANS